MKKFVLFALALSLGLVVGCENKKTPAPAPAAGDQTAPADQGGTAPADNPSK